jgi:outer membrane protein assembly factor BamB
MNRITQIENIYQIIEHKNKCFIFGDNYCKSDGTDYNLSLSERGCILFWSENFLLSGKEFGEIKVLNERFNEIHHFEEGMNLSYNLELNGDLILPNRITKSFWKITPDLKIIDLHFIANYHRVINNLIFNIFLENRIDVFEFGLETPLWQIDTSLYGVFKEPIDNGFTEHPNTIDRPIFGDENCVYVPMKGGQLLALNASDGSLKWMLEMEYSGFYGIYEDRIYKNSNHTLYEIDSKSGSILRSLEYRYLKELKGLFGFSADFRVYEDYIILKDQLRGWVAMFDRKTMTLAHLAETGSRIGSDASFFHWLDNKLYVLDKENTLHIFEI